MNLYYMRIFLKLTANWLTADVGRNSTLSLVDTYISLERKFQYNSQLFSIFSAILELFELLNNQIRL
jgi:hypothetical protein